MSCDEKTAVSSRTWFRCFQAQAVPRRQGRCSNPRVASLRTRLLASSTERGPASWRTPPFGLARRRLALGSALLELSRLAVHRASSNVPWAASCCTSVGAGSQQIVEASTAPSSGHRVLAEAARWSRSAPRGRSRAAPSSPACARGKTTTTAQASVAVEHPGVPRPRKSAAARPSHHTADDDLVRSSQRRRRRRVRRRAVCAARRPRPHLVLRRPPCRPRVNPCVFAKRPPRKRPSPVCANFNVVAAGG